MVGRVQRRGQEFTWQSLCETAVQAAAGRRAHVLFTGTMAVLEGLTRIGKLPSMLPLLFSACRASRSCKPQC